jgi:hypothetical protein
MVPEFFVVSSKETEIYQHQIEIPENKNIFQPLW